MSSEREGTLDSKVENFELNVENFCRVIGKFTDGSKHFLKQM